MPRAPVDIFEGVFLLEDEGKLKELSDHIKVLRKKVVSFQLATGDSAEELIAQNVFHLASKVLYYSLNLNWGILELCKERNIFSSLFLIRANYEATGVLGNVYDKMQRYYSENLPFEKFDELVVRYSLGSEMIDGGERNVPERVQVLNGIDSVDKWLTKESGEKTDSFRNSYNYLSQFCHPNFHGLNIISSLNQGFVSPKTIQEIAERHTDEFLTYLKISNQLFIGFHEKILNLLKEKEGLG